VKFIQGGKVMRKIVLSIIVLVLLLIFSGCSQLNKNKSENGIQSSQPPTISENKNNPGENTSTESSISLEPKVYTQSPPYEGVIPFLTFTVNENNKYWHYVEAYLNYWDTRN